MSAKFIKYFVWIVKNWYPIYEKIIRVIGDIKIFKTPCFIQYCPEEYDYAIRGTDIKNICKVLEPGDIVLRHYKSYLDSYLIPGKYSHSGLYIGNDTIIHAVAEGVKEESIIDFCQCDGICVLRPKSGQDKAISIAKSNLGKSYDFKFDSDDKEHFYCHELTAQCYHPSTNIEAFYPTIGKMELKFLRPKYLAKSFIDNEFFKQVVEIG